MPLTTAQASYLANAPRRAALFQALGPRVRSLAERGRGQRRRARLRARRRSSCASGASRSAHAVGQRRDVQHAREPRATHPPGPGFVGRRFAVHAAPRDVLPPDDRPRSRRDAAAARRRAPRRSAREVRGARRREDHRRERGRRPRAERQAARPARRGRQIPRRGRGIAARRRRDPVRLSPHLAARDHARRLPAATSTRTSAGCATVAIVAALVLIGAAIVATPTSGALGADSGGAGRGDPERAVRPAHQSRRRRWCWPRSSPGRASFAARTRCSSISSAAPWRPSRLARFGGAISPIGGSSRSAAPISPPPPRSA